MKTDIGPTVAYKTSRGIFLSHEEANRKENRKSTMHNDRLHSWIELEPVCQVMIITINNYYYVLYPTEIGRVDDE